MKFFCGFCLTIESIKTFNLKFLIKIFLHVQGACSRFLINFCRISCIMHATETCMWCKFRKFSTQFFLMFVCFYHKFEILSRERWRKSFLFAFTLKPQQPNSSCDVWKKTVKNFYIFFLHSKSSSCCCSSNERRERKVQAKVESSLLICVRWRWFFALRLCISMSNNNAVEIVKEVRKTEKLVRNSFWIKFLSLRFSTFPSRMNFFFVFGETRKWLKIAAGTRNTDLFLLWTSTYIHSTSSPQRTMMTFERLFRLWNDKKLLPDQHFLSSISMGWVEKKEIYSWLLSRIFY